MHIFKSCIRLPFNNPQSLLAANESEMETVTLIASIDQGTQSTRVFLYDTQLHAVASAQKDHAQHYPEPGMVEHDATEIMNNIIALFAQVSDRAQHALGPTKKLNIACVGVTNQRETTVAWDRVTGKPLCNAIVWLDTRTAEIVETLKEQNGGVDGLREDSGLPMTTYFSGTKIKWLLDNVPAVQQALKDDRCYFGTIDSWVIWNLTGGPQGGAFVTDVTNASRTQLMDIYKCQWSEKLLKVFGVPRNTLPEIRSCAECYGTIRHCEVDVFEGVPITGCAGDQQAACLGQGVFQKGQVKCTYGTGAFILMNTGQTAVQSTSGLLTTPCFQLGKNSPVVYALEGSVAIAGAGISWLKDNLGLIASAAETSELISSVNNTAGVYFVPAFSGLFAPRWRDDARGCIVGLTQHTKKAHIVRALMESVGFQLCEIVTAMLEDMRMEKLAVIRVDGGMSHNAPFLQLTSNLCGCPVERPENTETTAIGAAVAAGLGQEIWTSVAEVEKILTTSSTQWTPGIDKKERERKLRNWNKAVERSFNWV